MIYALTIEELREEWPKTEDGIQCANLMQRYLYTLLTSTASANQCGAAAAAEAAADKTIAEMTRTLASLVIPRAPKSDRRPGMKPLHRFEPQKPENK